MKYKILFLGLALSVLYLDLYSVIELGKKTEFKITIQQVKIENSTIEYLRENKNFLTDKKFKVFKIFIMNNSDANYFYNATGSTLKCIEDEKYLMNMQLLKNLQTFSSIGMIGLALGGLLTLKKVDFWLFFSGIAVSFALPIYMHLYKQRVRYFIDNHLFSSILQVKPHEFSEKYFIVKKNWLRREQKISFISHEDQKTYTHSFRLPSV